jgi:hypothetical protein
VGSILLRRRVGADMLTGDAQRAAIDPSGIVFI